MVATLPDLAMWLLFKCCSTKASNNKPKEEAVEAVEITATSGSKRFANAREVMRRSSCAVLACFVMDYHRADTCANRGLSLRLGVQRGLAPLLAGLPLCKQMAGVTQRRQLITLACSAQSSCEPLPGKCALSSTTYIRLEYTLQHVWYLLWYMLRTVTSAVHCAVHICCVLSTTQCLFWQAVGVMNQLALELDINSAVDNIRDVVLELLNCERVTLFLVDNQQKELRCAA